MENEMNTVSHVALVLPKKEKPSVWLDYPARVITLLFHPIFMPLFGMYLMLGADTEIRDLTTPKMRTGIFMLLGILIAAPVLSTLVMFSFRLVKNLEFVKPSERMAPFIATAAFYIMAYVMLLKGKSVMHPIIFSCLSAAIVAMVLSLLITTRFKISMHAMGISGVVGMLYALTETVFFRDMTLIALLLCAVGLVGAARMIRGVHTFPQILAGAALGFVSQYVFIVYRISF